MAKSDTNEINDRIKELTPDQRIKLIGEAPAAEAAGKLLTDEQVQAELIKKAYCVHSEADALSFDEWVQMKIPSLDEGDHMATRPSVARSLFDEIIAHPGHADSIAYLRAMVNSNPPTVETEHLDFKSASLNGQPINDNDVKKTWSEALAGFATTGGGVLIWGIDARKPAGGTVDQAIDFKLVVDPNALKSRLQQLHHQSTDPPVLGVVIKAFPDPAENGQGFVVCYIPRK